jgi:hypothetical protein
MDIVVEKKCTLKNLNWLEDSYIKFDYKPQALQWNLIQPLLFIVREFYCKKKIQFVQEKTL